MNSKEEARASLLNYVFDKANGKVIVGYTLRNDLSSVEWRLRVDAENARERRAQQRCENHSSQQDPMMSQVGSMGNAEGTTNVPLFQAAGAGGLSYSSAARGGGSAAFYPPDQQGAMPPGYVGGGATPFQFNTQQATTSTRPLPGSSEDGVVPSLDPASAARTTPSAAFGGGFFPPGPSPVDSSAGPPRWANGVANGEERPSNAGVGEEQVRETITLHGDADELSRWLSLQSGKNASRSGGHDRPAMSFTRCFSSCRTGRSSSCVATITIGGCCTFTHQSTSAYCHPRECTHFTQSTCPFYTVSLKVVPVFPLRLYMISCVVLSCFPNDDHPRTMPRLFFCPAV